jgi:hypothetical protein
MPDAIPTLITSPYAYHLAQVVRAVPETQRMMAEGEPVCDVCDRGAVVRALHDLGVDDLTTRQAGSVGAGLLELAGQLEFVDRVKGYAPKNGPAGPITAALVDGTALEVTGPRRRFDLLAGLVPPPLASYTRSLDGAFALHADRSGLPRPETLRWQTLPVYPESSSAPAHGLGCPMKNFASLSILQELGLIEEETAADRLGVEPALVFPTAGRADWEASTIACLLRTDRDYCAADLTGGLPETVSTAAHRLEGTIAAARSSSNRGVVGLLTGANASEIHALAGLTSDLLPEGAAEPPHPLGASYSIRMGGRMRLAWTGQFRNNAAVQVQDELAGKLGGTSLIDQLPDTAALFLLGDPQFDHIAEHADEHSLGPAFIAKLLARGQDDAGMGPF